MKISVAGIGYVGFSLAVLLASKHEVFAFDIDQTKVDKVNRRESVFKDKEIEEALKQKINLKATTDEKTAFENSEYIILALPTNYDEKTKFFDTKSIKVTIEKIKNINPDALIIIKSTVPIGFTSQIKKECNHDNIIFSPEFLREGKALYDNLYPSRIIMGANKQDTTQVEKCKRFAEILRTQSKKPETEIFIMNSTEAEAVKLFANNYLAMRVAFFNELDTFAEVKNLNAKDIISGVCLDARIGNQYNNPSFGYGGYCFPKDSKQMVANFENIPNNIIKSIVDSNATRKSFITNQIIKKACGKTIGIYRLIMKAEADNLRSSAIQDIIQLLKEKNLEIVIYEPIITESTFNGCKVIKNLDEFKKVSNVIVANRTDSTLNDVKEKIYSRNVFDRD